MTYEELNRVQEPLSEDLRACLEERFKVDLRATTTQLDGGDECAIYQSGAFIVRIAPRGKDLTWTNDLTRYVAQTVPEVVAPVAALDGATVVLYNGFPVSVFPFIDAKMLDDEPPLDLVVQAGQLLKRIHTAMPDWAGPPAPRRSPRSELADAELEAWHASLGEPRALIHGDFYRRNILVRDGRIVGLIDWDEAHADHLGQEIAWSAWEFSHEDDGSIDEEYWRTYLTAYGPRPERVDEDAINFVRWRLRDEMLYQLAAKDEGRPFDQEYFDSEMHAFHTLKR